jgi:anti-sigma factor RsiW
VNCEELRTLLHGYVDEELDLVRSLEIEHHLEGCSACALACKELQALRKALKDASLYQRAPVGLPERVRSALRPRGNVSARPTPRVPAWIASPWITNGLAASLAFLALLVWGLVYLHSLPSAEEFLASEVVASHVRSLMVNHLLDVPSSDQHTVKPWFTGQLNFAPEVKNLADKGYDLIGGRLDYLDNHKTAVLVYKHRKHMINVFIWPAPNAADQALRKLSRQGYHLLHWTRAGLTYWVISDMNETDLQEFSGLIQPRSEGKE